MINQFDAQTIKMLRAELKSALKPIEDKYGLLFNLGTVHYSSSAARGKLTINTKQSLTAAIIPSGTSTAGPLAIPPTAMSADFQTYAASWGLQKTDLGRQFRSGAGIYTIVGARPQSWKYPVIGRSKNGTEYKFKAADVQRGLI